MVVHACNLSTHEAEAGESPSLGYIAEPCLQKKEENIIPFLKIEVIN
jgi:hypothetical protein